MSSRSDLKQALPFNSTSKRCTLSYRLAGARKLFLGLIFVSILMIVFTTFQMDYFMNSLLQKKTTRICCLILTIPNNFISRAKAINDTWAPRCDKYYFISESPENSSSLEARFQRKLPVAPIKGIIKGYGHLTRKTFLAFLFAYKTHRNDFDWFVKADDDTYIIMENLRAFLQEQNASEPVTFGYNFNIVVEGGYHSGGPSYVLSREALTRLYRGLNNRSKHPCPLDGGAEDVDIAACLRKQGAYTGVSLDKYDRELFHPLKFQDLFSGHGADWLNHYAENRPRRHYNCCSERSIGFHRMSTEDHYFMEFLLYRARLPKTYEPGWVKKRNRTTSTSSTTT